MDAFTTIAVGKLYAPDDTEERYNRGLLDELMQALQDIPISSTDLVELGLRIRQDADDAREELSVDELGMTGVVLLGLSALTILRSSYEKTEEEANDMLK